MGSVFPWKRNNGFSLHCCRAASHFVLLLTINIASVSTLLAWYPACKSYLICTTLCCHLASLFLSYFFTLFHKLYDFSERIAEHEKCALIFSTTLKYNYCCVVFVLQEPQWQQWFFFFLNFSTSTD